MREAGSEALRNTEALPDTQSEALTPHRYPAWLLGVAGAVGLAGVYSVVLLPRYYTAAELLDKAVQADAAQHVQQSLDLLDRAGTYVPDSKKIHLQEAYEDFKLPSEEAHARAMAALDGITMDKDEWSRMREVLPAQYRDQFREAPEK